MIIQMEKSARMNLELRWKRYKIVNLGCVDTTYVDNSYTLYRFFLHSNVIFQVIPDSDGDKMKEHIFRVFDKNGDGSIDFSEFMVSKRN